MAEFIITNGETLADTSFGYGDSITIKKGGTLSNVVIPESVEIIMLEDGAAMTGIIKTAKELTIAGNVNAAQADLILDISDRKPEEPIMVSDWSLLTADSLSVVVDPNQDKGTYRLAGNATGFAGSITIRNSFDRTLGELSLTNNVLDDDITRYTLSLNEANELCLTVSSNIPDTSDYVLLYKNGVLVDTSKNVSGITLSSTSDCDEIILLAKGYADNITIDEGGRLKISPGSTATNVFQNEGGTLQLVYAEGDTTSISGTNSRFGSFSVENDRLYNLNAESITVDGNVLLEYDLSPTDQTSETILNCKNISKNASVVLNVKYGQRIGKYQIASGIKNAYNGFTVNVTDPDDPSSTIQLEGLSDTAAIGGFVYELSTDHESNGEENLYLTISMAEDTDQSYRIVYWDSQGRFGHAETLDGIEIGSDQYKDVYVRKDGILTNSVLSAGGTLTVFSGGNVSGLDQKNGGLLSFDYTEGDQTLISGTNEIFGLFSVGNDVLKNIVVSDMTVDGNISIDNLYLQSGDFTAQNGVHITGQYGIKEYGSKSYFLSGTTAEELYSMNGSKGYLHFCTGSLTNDCTFEAYHINTWGGTLRNTTLRPLTCYLEGGYFDNVVFATTFRGEDITRNLQLIGPITVVTGFNLSSWYGSISANGNRIILDYTEKTPEQIQMIDLSKISEDAVFQIDLSSEAIFGTYNIAIGEVSFVDQFSICVDGVEAGVLSASNQTVQYNNKEYKIIYNEASQKIYLSIDPSQNDPTYNVQCWDSDGNYFHAESMDSITIDSSHYSKVIVRNNGVLTNSKLNGGGILIVESGGTVTNLSQDKGKLSFSYSEGDTTVISGTNTAFGDFEVKNNCLSNIAIAGEVSFSGNIKVHNFCFGDGIYTANQGVVHSGQLINTAYNHLYFDSSCTLQNVVSSDTLGAFSFDGTSICDSSINGYNVNLNNTVIENSVFDSRTLYLGEKGSLGNVSLSTCDHMGWLDIRQTISLTGSLSIDVSPLHPDYATILGNGHNIEIDLSLYTENSSVFLDLGRVFNSELSIRINHDQILGKYKLCSNASKIATGDPKGVWDEDTNTWSYQGSVIGDMDGIIEVRDENGILLANCTVNGDTEYFGRYNYTVSVDAKGDMYLEIGWNTREGRTYTADGLDNDSFVTAVSLPETGTRLTIDSVSDVDWFKFTLDATGRSSSYIGIDFKQWAGDLDLYLYDANGNLLDYAKSVTDNERISLKGLAAGDYCVKVVGYGENVNEYKLAYSLPEPIVLHDAYENGDTKAHSYHLGKLTEQITLNAAISRADDQDYYMFQLPKKGLTCDTITLTYDDDVGDLDLYLYGSNGSTLLVSSTNSEGGKEQVSLAGMKHGVYYVAVKAKNGGAGNYQLVFDVNASELTPDIYEKCGNNNTQKKATDLHAPNGEGRIENLSIHSDEDVDFYKFSLLETGSADDWISISYEVCRGDLDIEILNSDGEVAACSRTAENEDTVSLKGFETGEYYISVSGYNNVANNYTLSWNVTNSSLIPSDSYEGMEPIAIRENQTITGLSIAKTVKDDETRADTFKIVLEYDAWKRSKIILTDYRSDWEDGMKYVIRDANNNVLDGYSGTGSEISLYGLSAGDYYLTVDTPNKDEYSEYSLVAQGLPDSDKAVDNTWSIFVYMAGDNNLEGYALTELLYMQNAILPENVEVYVLLDRSEGWSAAQRDWTDTRVGKIRHRNGDALAVEWMYFDGVNTSTYMNTDNLECRKEWDTGNVNTLEAFLDWGMNAGRAENYALILYDHGSSLGYNCQDGESGSIMAVEDIAELLDSNKEKYKDLSVVAFDQCLMGSDVVITTLEGTVDYVVASEAIGWTPNLSIMYKVLLNSLETNMTPQQLAQKMVRACNCSGLVDLTMASFDTSDHTLGEALQAFGEASKGFTRQDWIAICKSFALAYNYGDDICAYSDLGFFLSTLKEYSTSISGTLREATENLYSIVFDRVVDSTMITPAVFGSGLAVFNPVLSSDIMQYYYYAPGAYLDYYGTIIGQSEWGKFLYTVGQLAEDCTEFFVDSRTNLTFTDFSYSIEGEEVKVINNLGPFYGNGVEYRGLYMDRKAAFTITLENPGIVGDEIRIAASDPDAHITITLIQTEYPLFGDPIRTVRRSSTDGSLSLAGIDPAKDGVDTEYDLIITSDRETTYDLSFVANWTSGSDYFDYSRSGLLGAQGNGSIEKATVLTAGNYGGLVTYTGDPDFYQLKTVYSDTLDVTVYGSGLTVQEYDADGLLVQGAKQADGQYTITVANGNYLRVEGNAALAEKAVNSYSLFISDISSTYVAPDGTEAQLPGKPEVSGELKDNQMVVTVSVEEGMKGYQSGDLQNWTPCENDTFVVTENGLYYFKAVDPETEMESKYTSFQVVVVPEKVSDVVPQTQTWEKVGEAVQYVVEYSTDGAFGHVIQLVVDSTSLDSYQLPGGGCHMRVKPVGGGEWTEIEPVVAEEINDEPKFIKSNADGHADIFFVNTVGAWEPGYMAQHVGSTFDLDDNKWTGTKESVALYGKNKLADIIEGSTDANILLMTDDSIGDALFVDDIYSASPDELGLSQSRIAQIDEIRAGAGDDIVDMTSQRFEYIGDGLTIRGGEGNDTIWANKGSNMLFGDAGNDRIVGASGSDVIAGGIGNDSMHGGGGNDVFTFCDNWGTDTVEQLATGKVTLWFASGDESNWNAESLTYTDGTNSVTVKGVSAEQVTLKFGDDGSDQYKMLAAAGSFAEFTSQRIFEESQKGMLAGSY